MTKAALGTLQGGFFRGEYRANRRLINRYRRNPGMARLMRGAGDFGSSVRASATACQSREGGKGQHDGSGGGRGGGCQTRNGGPVRCWISGGARAVRTTAQRKAAALRRWPSAALRRPRGPSRKPLIVPALALVPRVRVQTAAPCASGIHRRRRGGVQAQPAAKLASRRRSGHHRAARSG